MDAPRGGGGKGGGGYKESGLHVLYLLANSLVCLKGSGDRSERPGAGRAFGAGPTRAGLADGEVIVLDGADGTTGAPSQPRLSSTAAPQRYRPLGDGGGSRRETAFSPEELATIRSLALSELAFPLLVHSLCPTIYGHELVKAGILLGLFGGSSNKTPSARQSANTGTGATSRGFCGTDEEWAPSAKDFKVRPDIHVLVVGDPGLGKVSFSMWHYSRWD